MSKRKIEDSVDWERQPCPLCSAETLPKEDNIQWIACEACRQWYHSSCLSIDSGTIAAYFCENCHRDGKGTTQTREERPKRARIGIDYTALDAGQHVNSLRHAYTSLIETRTFSASLAKVMDGAALTTDHLGQHGFMEPIIIHQMEGLNMSLPFDLTVDRVAQLVGSETPIEVMDVPTQDEDKGWTLGRWASYYNESNPRRVRNVISLEVTDTKLGDLIKRPRIVRQLDVVSRYWPRELLQSGKTPKVQAYCLMSLQNSYTDFHVDFAGTSVYYHILQGSKTFLFIPPSGANLNKYSDWCKSSNQSTTFLADECKDTFKVELCKGDTMFIPSGWIHAVHTPEKSLVIGGNFLHLYGMQKHLEIADIEELTKVPGKFRFPYFTKTLWFTAIGVLCQLEAPNKFQIMGLYKLAEYLFKKAIIHQGKNGRKGLDELPSDYMKSAPTLVVKLLFNRVQYHASKLQLELPELLPIYELSSSDLESCPAIVKSHASMESDDLSKFPPDHWYEVSAEPDQPAKMVSEDQSMAAKDQILEHAAPQNGAQLSNVDADSPNIFAEQNSYLPPLMSFKLLPVVMPQTYTQANVPTTESNKNPTTCFRCKTRKRKCDKLRPCDSCKEAGLADTCSDSGAINRKAPLYVDVTPLSAETDQLTSSTIHEAVQGNSLEDTQGVSMKDKKSLVWKQPRQTGGLGNRCSRCAKDKRPCGKERPICDRCKTKGLKESECIYLPSGRQKYVSTTSTELIDGVSTVPPDGQSTDKSSSTRGSPESTHKNIEDLALQNETHATEV